MERRTFLRSLLGIPVLAAITTLPLGDEQQETPDPDKNHVELRARGGNDGEWMTIRFNNVPPDGKVDIDYMSVWCNRLP